MTAKDILGLVIKIYGFYVGAQAFYELFFAVTESIGLLSASRQTPIAHCIWAIGYLIGAVAIVRNTDRLIEFAYNPVKNTKAD